MLAITETRDGRVYLVLADTDWNEPRIISSYYLTNSDPEVIPSETRLTKFGDIYTAWLYGKEIPVYLASHSPAFTEFTPLPKPRGKHVWKCGEWKKG